MNIREIRKRRKMSVQALADASGLHRRTVQDAEKRNNCTVSTAIKLADALNVTLDELCRDDYYSKQNSQ